MVKFSLTLCAFLASALCSSASIDLGSRSDYTPYDRYLAPVKQVLTHLQGEEDSMERVRQLMSTGRSFRYSYTDPYVAASPATTSSLRAGDCKAKALWLAAQLHDENIRFVIGKARASSRISHAWLIWQHDAHWWILDCTNNREPIAADHVSSWSYIPYYSFSKNGEYRHEATRTYTASAVAARHNPPVADRSTAK